MHGRNSQLEPLFQQLGKLHASLSWGNDSIFKKPLTADIAKRLRKTCRQLQSKRYEDDRISMVSELFMDNYHVLTDAATVCQDFLVPDLYRRLPEAAEAKQAGVPRILLLARELIKTSKLQFDGQVLQNLLSGYQEDAPLLIAEIWALPIMLRLVLLNECLGPPIAGCKPPWSPPR